MTDLSPSVWKEIERASVYLPQEGTRGVGRYIGIGILRNIIKKSRRTNDQNALLWSLYDDVLRKGGETLGGWTKDDLHEWALGEYWGWDECKAFGRTRLKPKRRSSRLAKLEFADFVDWFVRKMAEHGIVLELPDESKEVA